MKPFLIGAVFGTLLYFGAPYLAEAIVRSLP